MRPPNRTHLLVAVLVLGLAFSLVLTTPFVEHDPGESETNPEYQVVTPVANGSESLWPYTSRGPTVTRATLPINLVVNEDASTVYRLLATGADGSGLAWNESKEQWVTGDPERSNVSINGTGVHWGSSTGSDRYSYVLTDSGWEWKTAAYQIHDGSYFGSRHHLRLYEGGTSENRWTAIQAHREYWDWFRLRHDVTSLSRARHHVERDLLDSGLAADVSRVRWGNGGALDADGWVTAIELTKRVTSGPVTSIDPVSSPLALSLVPFIGVTLQTFRDELLERTAPYLDRLEASRIDRYTVALVATTMAIPLVVRVGAIAAERQFPEASPVQLGAPFYLLLVLGLPAAAYFFGRRVPGPDGFVAAVIGTGTGLMADYAYLGIVAIPFGALVQRVVLLFALGLIAAGGTRWSIESVVRHRYHGTGLALWVVALVWPLFG